MIKVELFYKVTMHGTDWLMSENEYEEFRTNALNLPLARMDKEEQVSSEKEDLPKSVEKVHEPIQKVQEQEYKKYIDMINEGKEKREVTAAMIEDLEIANTTANQYYYSKIKPNAKTSEKVKQIENEKKDLLRELESKPKTPKIQIIPEEKMGEPEPGKIFSKEFKEKMQKKTSGGFGW